jgi:sugar phosphate isomerase/epimerase
MSIQLWSTRGDTPLPEQLNFLASLGYTDAQPFHDQYDDVPLLKDSLAQAGLTSVSGHFRISMFDGDARPVIAAATALDMKLVVAPYLEESARPTDKDGWKQLHKVLLGYKERVADAGLSFAWHNHEFEFAPFGDGSCPIEYLLDEDIDFAADIAWIYRANVDPEPWLRRYRGRIPAVHIKDVAAAGDALDEGGFADIGDGIMDWNRLWAVLDDLEVPLRAAEHDQPNDWRRFATVSARALGRLRAGERLS